MCSKLASLPNAIFSNKLYQSIEKDCDIEELMALDYSRLTVALLGAVKALTQRIEELESK